VKQTNLSLVFILHDTIAYRRFTYSTGNLSPHFMQIIFIASLALKTIQCRRTN